MSPDGGIISSNADCSRIGGNVLKHVDGASSIDAAISTALCLSILNPHAAGIGG